MSDVCVPVSYRLVEVAGIPPSTPRFSLFDGHSSNRSELLSFITATLGTIGWLGLVRQGLSPCKKRQAALGAPTAGLTVKPPDAESASVPRSWRGWDRLPESVGDSVPNLSCPDGLTEFRASAPHQDGGPSFSRKNTNHLIPFH